MPTDDAVAELPGFVAEAFLEGYDSGAIDKTELITRDATWQGKGPVPDERRIQIYVAAHFEEPGGVVIADPFDVPEAEKQLLFSNRQEAIEEYQATVSELVENELGMVSAAGRVTVRREPAEHFEVGVETPTEVVSQAEVNSDHPPCNRCRTPTEEPKTIGDVVFCSDCHDEVCSLCGSEIVSEENQYNPESISFGTTCTDCTADRVDWLCAECGKEIRKAESRVEIIHNPNDLDRSNDELKKGSGLSGTYCEDCEPTIRNRIDEAEPSEDTGSESAPF